MAECPYHFTISGHFQPKAMNSFLKGEAYFDVTKKKKTPFIVRQINMTLKFWVHSLM